MSDDLSEPFRRPLGAYKVGYGKPPEEHRFKPGQSGNPRGRPPGTKKQYSLVEPLTALVFEEAGRLIPVNESGKKSLVPLGRVVVRQTAMNAAKGIKWAVVALLKLLAEANEVRERQRSEIREAVIQYSERWHAEAARRRQCGSKEQMWFPYPEDIYFDEVGDVWVRGPLRKEDKASWDYLRREEKLHEAEIKAIRRELANSPADAKYVKSLREYLAETVRDLRNIKRGLEGTGPVR